VFVPFLACFLVVAAFFSGALWLLSKGMEKDD
jgi:lipopolysaccharide export LptBFGC system permease protein LptF